VGARGAIYALSPDDEDRLPRIEDDDELMDDRRYTWDAFVELRELYRLAARTGLATGFVVDQ
jgi:hypothetical protein